MGSLGRASAGYAWAHLSRVPAGLEGPDGLHSMCGSWCWLLALVTSMLLHEAFRVPGGRTSFLMWRLQVSVSSQKRRKLPDVLGLGPGVHTVLLLAQPMSQSKSRGQPRFRGIEIDTTSWQGNNREFLTTFNLLQWAVKRWARDLTSLCLASPPHCEMGLLALNRWYMQSA